LCARADDFWYSISQFPISSVYVAGFLANLNARDYVRGEGGIQVISNIEDLPSPQQTSMLNASGLRLVEPIVLHHMHGSTGLNLHENGVSCAISPAIVANVYAQKEIVVEMQKDTHTVTDDGTPLDFSRAEDTSYEAKETV
jgi:hypothetical protein